MRFCSQITSAVAAIMVTAVPILAKINIPNLGRKCSSGEQHACRELADIAEKDKDFNVRFQAVLSLTDQSLLAHVAENAEDKMVRSYAMRGLWH